jgi:hypothetical protein
MTGGDRIPTFHRSYARVLQDEPDIVMIHGEIMPTLPKPAKGETTEQRGGTDSGKSPNVTPG